MFDTLTKTEVPPCPVGKWLNTLLEEDRENFNSALALPNKAVSNQTLIKAAQAEAGHTLDKNTLSKHRSKVCRCFQD